MFRNITRKLGYFDLMTQLFGSGWQSFETRVEDLALARLQTIHKRGYRSVIIGHREMNKLMIDKVRVANTALSMVDAKVSIVMTDPILSLVSLVFVEGKIDSVVIYRLDQWLELDNMTVYFSKVFFSLCRCRGTQTFVVLDFDT